MARLLNYEMQKAAREQTQEQAAARQSEQERQAAARREAGKAKAATKKRKAEEAEKTAEAAREAEVNIICPLQSRRRCMENWWFSKGIHPKMAFLQVKAKDL